MTQYPESTCSRAVKSKVIKLASLIEIICEYAIGRRQEIVSADTCTGITLRIHRRPLWAIMFQYPDSTRPGTKEDEMIEFASVVVVESEGSISGTQKVITSNAISRIPFSVYRFILGNILSLISAATPRLLHEFCKELDQRNPKSADDFSRVSGTS